MSGISLVLIKPDAFARDLVEVIVQHFLDEGLKVVYQREVQLDEELIRRFQPAVNPPSEYGEEWKYELFEALCERPVRVLIVEGHDALEQSVRVKRKLRASYAPESDYRVRVIRNLLHTPSTIMELQLNMEVLVPEVMELLW